MALSEKYIRKVKEHFDEMSGKDVSWEEATEAAAQLAKFAELMYESWLEDRRREKRLTESPKGYVLSGVGYTCAICWGSTPKEGNWYDRWGIKCLVCQAAIDRNEIPPSLAKYKDSWYSKYDLERTFNLKGPVLRAWVKNGLIKSRPVTMGAGRVHAELFLIRDNKDFLPPKKLVESRLVKESKNGQDWYRSEPWYCFVNPFEHLKDYGIMKYMRTTKSDAPATFA